MRLKNLNLDENTLIATLPVEGVYTKVAERTVGQGKFLFALINVGLVLCIGCGAAVVQIPRDRAVISWFSRPFWRKSG
jgi:hypothetical protein